MKYAEVAVNAPVGGPRTFTYSLPLHQSVLPGCAVWVPFGPRVLQGIVFSLTERPLVEETRQIIDVIDPRPLLSEARIELARWIAEYYLAPYFEAAYLMLPPAFERKLLTFVEPAGDAPRKPPADLTPNQKKMFNFLLENGRTESRQFKGRLAERYIIPTVRQLERKGLVARTSELQGERIRPKEVLHVRLAVDKATAQSEIPVLERRAFRQAELMRFLLNAVESVPLAEALKRTGVTSTVARALGEKGLVA
ncbi:MAG: hypothetical protein R6U37_09070 [Dehalococcoidia bacterium]